MSGKSKPRGPGRESSTRRDGAAGLPTEADPLEERGRWLRKEERDELVRELAARDNYRHLRGWTTIKNELKERGYEVVEKRKKESGKRKTLYLISKQEKKK